jgi:hypothetical protein
MLKLIPTVLVAFVSLAVAPAYADLIQPDLSITLSPNVGSGYAATGTVSSGDCTLFSYCVQFSGTLTDNDNDPTDSTFTSITGISVAFTPTAGNTFLALDGTFDADVPTIFIGDPTFTFPSFPTYNYVGPIFGIDIAPNTPIGEYDGILTVSTLGGTNDPNGGGQTFTQTFTLDVLAPEPASLSLLLMGLLPLAVWRSADARERAKRKWLSSEVSR